MLSVIKLYFLLLARYLKPQWLRALLLMVVLLSGIGTRLTNPQILKAFIDTATGDGNSASLLAMSLAFVGLALLGQVLGIIENYLSVYIGWTALNHLRRDLLIHCLALDLGYHTTHTPGEMIERIDGDVTLLSKFFSIFVIKTSAHIMLILGVLCLFFFLSWLVGIVMVAYVIFAFLLLLYLRKYTSSAWKDQREISTEFSGFLAERLEGTDDIHANGAAMYTIRRFLLLKRRWFPINKRAIRANGILTQTLIGLTAGVPLLALAMGAVLWSTRTITLGTVYLLFSYTSMLTYPLQQIQSQLQDFQQSEACIKRVNQLLQTESTLTEEAGYTLPEGPLAINCKNVTFGYDPKKPVLQNVTFQIQSGQILGILGHTGCGKTTLGRLLFRLYDIQSGTIEINGIPIKDVRLQELRKRIGVITQRVHLFRASIRDNLTLFNSHISDHRLLAALESVGLKAWYNSLPQGLDTILGVNGEGLSAGQAQLLAFARVFLTDPDLVILDEASSRLDPATEQQIEQAVSKLLENRTVVIVAHRLQTVQRADHILILEGGKIREYGPRESLEKDSSSHFSYLLRTGLAEVEAL